MSNATMDDVRQLVTDIASDSNTANRLIALLDGRTDADALVRCLERWGSVDAEDLDTLAASIGCDTDTL
jgi:hypothetical protein